MITCVVVDDEQHAIDLLKRYLADVPMLDLVFSSTNPVEAFQYLQRHPVDLVFLDIHMPELQGLHFLKLLDPKTKVILTTGYPEHALAGYEHDVLDYLLKPILFDRFMKAVQKAIAFFNRTSCAPLEAPAVPAADDFILVKTEGKGRLVRLRLAEIKFVEGLGNYLSLYTTDNRRIVTQATLKELEQALPQEKFLRIHRSYIIPPDKIEGVEGNHVQIGPHRIPIGESYKARFFEVLHRRILKG